MNTRLQGLLAGMFGASVGIAIGQPAITEQPRSCTNCVGTTATLTVVATGTEPLSYQWQKLSGAWSDLANGLETSFALTNLQAANAGDYRVVITNMEGAVTSEVATLTVVVPPSITLHPADRIVVAGANTSLSASALGTWLKYQWRRNGTDLPDATNAVLALVTVQNTNAGAYAVVVTNLAGAITSRLAQVSVGQPGVQTNEQGHSLLYRLFEPPDYDAARSYPLVLFMHGAGGLGSDNVRQLTDTSAQYVFLNASNMAKHPCFFVAPQIPAPVGSYDPNTYWLRYSDLAAALVMRLQNEFSMDSNRLYVTGLSMGGMASWALLARYPDLFACGVPVCGSWYFTNMFQEYLGIRTPVWNFHAAPDATVPVSASDEAIARLRKAGQNPIYTRYATGGHDSWTPGYYTPGLVDWVMACRRGVPPTHGPLLSVTAPTPESEYHTGSAAVNLGGTAEALGGPVTLVTWTNTANNAKGTATGSISWSIASVPLASDRTNLIIVVGTTTSWSSLYGGNTTFNDCLWVAAESLRATLTREGPGCVLNWKGSSPPYRVQWTTDPSRGDWTEFPTNVVPPLTLPLDRPAAFYRIVGEQ